MWRKTKNPKCSINTSCVRAMALSPDGNFIATTGEKQFDCTSTDIIIWNTKTSDVEHVLRDTGYTKCLAFSSDGSQIAAGKVGKHWMADAEVKVWDVKTRELIHTLSWKYTQEIRELASSPMNPAILAITSEKSTLQVDLDKIDETPPEFKGRNCRYSPMGDVVATSGMFSLEVYDIIIISAMSGVRIRRTYAHREPVSDLCWSPDGSKIASSCCNRVGHCKIWDSSTLEVLHTIDSSYKLGGFNGMSWGPNWGLALDRRLACAMALHDRIGNGSFMKHLHPDMLRIMTWDAKHE